MTEILNNMSLRGAAGDVAICCMDLQ